MPPAKPKKRRPSAKRLEQAKRVDALLAEHYPDAECSLIFDSPLQLLIATILSAQCTDERVNKVVPALFAKYPDAQAFADSRLPTLEKMVHSTGFYRNKAKSIKEASQDIVHLHNGEVPRTLDELTKLRGVGRKTANVVLGNAFDIPGMVVDTHVGRISRRLALTKETDPVKVEFDLMAVLPPEHWVVYTHRMIRHGRKYCKAPKPKCTGCPLEPCCPFPQKVFN